MDSGKEKVMRSGKEGYHPKKIFEFVLQLDSFEIHPIIILEYGVPFKGFSYKHVERFEGECFDSDSEHELAITKVEELAREGRFGAFVVSHDRRSGDDITTFYDVFAPMI